MVAIDASVMCFRRSDRAPRIQRMELRRRAKLSFVLMYAIMSAYESSLLSLSFPAMRLIVLAAEGPAPPVQENTSGVKVAFSISITRCSYFLFLVFMVFLGFVDVL